MAFVNRVVCVLVATAFSLQLIAAVDIIINLNNDTTAATTPASTSTITTTAGTTSTTHAKSMFANNNEQLPGSGIFEQQQQFYRTPVPCKASMKFGFGDALENPCKADPEGNPINFYNMKLLAAVVRSAMPAHMLPQPNLSKDVPDLVTRVGRILNPDAPREVEAYKRVYERMMQFNGESFDDDFDGTLTEEAGPQSRVLNPSANNNDVCGAGCERALPTECCPVRVEVGYPQFGQSAVSDKMFTIIQDFPNFVQPVYKRLCVSNTCNFLRGNCTQKYTPQAVFSASLSTSRVAAASAAAAPAPAPPKTQHSLFSPLVARTLPSSSSTSSSGYSNAALFGQDFILVESGCECRPDFFSAAAYAPSGDDQRPFS